MPGVCEINLRSKSYLPGTRRFLLFIAAGVMLCASSGYPQTGDPWMADAGAIASQMQPHHPPRDVVVVFDDSGSMRSRVPETGLSRWQEARAATASLLTSTLQPGDSLTMLPFDSTVHAPQRLKNLGREQIEAIGKLIPDAISGESGTNMRLAHDEALQLLEQARAGEKPAHWQAIVVVSDGFNDSPPLHSKAWYDYAKFCEVHSDDQNLYPATPECAAWREAARKFESSGEGKTFGIGVKVMDGIPEYRPASENPRTGSADANGGAIGGTVYEGDKPAEGVRVSLLTSGGQNVDSTETDAAGRFDFTREAAGSYTIVAARGQESAQEQGVEIGRDRVELHLAHSLIWLWALLIVVVVLASVAATAIARSRRTSKVRVQIKDSSGRNRTFWLGGGTRVSLGGKEAPGIFPLEVFAGPVAHLRHSASGYMLSLEKGIEAECAGRKFTGSGPVSENTSVVLRNGEAQEARFEFHDISTRTRTAASSITGAPGGDPYKQLDASLKR